MNHTLLITCILTCVACKSTTFNDQTAGDINAVVRIAILNFIEESKMYSRSSVFSVGVYDLNEDILGVTIDVSNSKILINLTSDGNRNKHIPSRYYEYEGNLFYWSDSNHRVSDKAMEVYEKYNLLDIDTVGNRVVPEFTIDDSQKGMHYYFCKNNYFLYKKKYSVIAMGYYDLPKIKCKQ